MSVIEVPIWLHIEKMVGESKEGNKVVVCICADSSDLMVSLKPDKHTALTDCCNRRESYFEGMCSNEIWSVKRAMLRKCRRRNR